MVLPEVECVFDTSRSIYCLKPKGSHVGLSGDEIEEVARRCNSHEKLVEIRKELQASDNWLHRLLKSCVIFLDDGEVTKRAVEKQSRYNNQALKEEVEKL